MAILSGAAPAPKAAVPIYPAKVQHTEEAYCLIDKFNTDGPKSWMKTLTEYVFYSFSLVELGLLRLGSTMELASTKTEL